MIKKIIMLLLIGFFITDFDGVSGQAYKPFLDSARAFYGYEELDSARFYGEIALEKAKAELGPEDSIVAVVLNELGKYAHSLGDYEACETYWSRGLAISIKLLGERHTQVARLISNLGAILMVRGQYEKALDYYGRAVEILEDIHGPEHKLVASVIENMAKIYYELDDFQTAESLYVRAMTIREKILSPDHPELAKSLNKLALLYMEQDRFAEAESYFMQALDIRKHHFGPKHTGIAYILNNLGYLYRKQGKYDKSRLFYEEALAMKKEILGPEHPDVVSSLENLGMLYMNLGFVDRADSSIRYTLAIKRKTYGEKSLEVAKSLSNLGVLLCEMTDYAEAESYFKRALEIKKAILGREHSSTAETMRELALLYWRQGRYPESESLLFQAREITEKIYGPEHSDLASLLNNMALLFCDEKKYEKAETLYLRAIDIWSRSHGAENLNVTRAYNNLAIVYWNLRNYNAVESLFNKSLAIKKELLEPNNPELCIIYNNLALLNLYNGNLEKSEKYLDLCLRISESTLGREHYRHAAYLETLSRLRRAQGRIGQAIAAAGEDTRIQLMNFIDNACFLPEKAVLQYSRIYLESVDNYLTCYFESRFPENALTKQISDLVLSAKGTVIDMLFSRQRIIAESYDSVIVDLLESLRAAKWRLSKSFNLGPGSDFESFRREEDSLKKRIDMLEAKLARSGASFMPQLSYEEINSRRVAALLPKNALLIEYMKYDFKIPSPDSVIPCYLALVINEHDQPALLNLGSASIIDSLVEKYRNHMLRALAPGLMPSHYCQQEYRQIARALYEELWAPLEKYTTCRELIIIAPDAALNMLSFAGMIVPDGRYLIEQHPLHYVSSGWDLVRLEEEYIPDSGLLAIADPDFDFLPVDAVGAADSLSKRAAEFHPAAIRDAGPGRMTEMHATPLPGTRKEVQKVVARWREMTDEPSQAYFGVEASEDNFKLMSGKCRIIHLATHGYFLDVMPHRSTPAFDLEEERGYIGENPLLSSGLFLAGANLHGQGADSAGIEDGILTAYEVSAMDLRGTEMVVLSACETGLGQVSRGTGVNGLRRAFQMAGARTVISALWPLLDKVTAEMITRLYDRKNESIPKLMQEMQIARIKELRDNNKIDHPRSWAALIAVGDWK